MTLASWHQTNHWRLGKWRLQEIPQPFHIVKDVTEYFIMTQVDSLRIYFVLPTDEAGEDDYSSDMKLAARMVSKYGGNVEFMKPSDCVDHLPQEKDVFVFDKFEGNAFETLKRNSSKILGARCLLTCISNGRTIPPNPHPVFTEGMRDLWITCSGFDQETKKQIQEKVQYMSGYYDNSLRSITTHLIAHNNISSKAIHAYKSNIKIMKISWVEDVWQQSLVNNVNGNDACFNKHLSQLFNNLSITTSGIAKREKDNLREAIENNGGRYMGTLEGNVTNVVLLTKPEGEKYKFAKTWNIPCVKPLWVYDCIDAKVILSFKSYIIDSSKPKSSTPNKENCTVNFSANFTANLSAINNCTGESNKQLTHLDETAATLSVRNDFQTPRVANLEQSKALNKFEKTTKSTHSHVINNILLKNLKDAGLFLDGLNIYLYGFHPEDVEKLKKVLNKGGAIRFNEMSESVTHIIAGKKDDGNLASLTKFGAYVLSLDWLVESMKLKCRANESKFLLVNNSSNSSEPPSPMSKRGAQLLSQTEGKTVQKPSFRLEDNNENEKLSQMDELLCRYNASQPGEPLDQPEVQPVASATSTANKSEISTMKSGDFSGEDFFLDVTFFLSSDLPEEEIQFLEDLITERKGQIVGKRDLGVPDYAVVPVIGASLTEVTAKEVVNIYFVKDCCVEGYLLSPRYYHQPVACVKNAAPLKNCVISVSNYVQGEREFVESLIEALGGIAQSLLARKPKQDALKSTHLICCEAQGQKYEGALRWGLPVVHHDWLLKCAALGIRVSEKPYLVGDSKPSSVESRTGIEVTPSTSRAVNITESVDASSRKVPSSNEDKATPPPIRFPQNSAFAQKTTPVHSAIARIKKTETPKSGNNSPDPNRTVTPTSPYGAFYGKGSPTPTTRKRIWKWMNQGAEFPLDPPSKPFESEEDSTPVSQLISRHLEMLKRKPEELPPDSPIGVPFKKLNLNARENENGVVSGLEKMRKIEEDFAKNGVIKSPPSVKVVPEQEGRQMVVLTESQAHTEVGWEDPGEKEVALGNLEKAAEVKMKPKVFMFSCLSDQLKEAKQLLEDRGGIVSSQTCFDAKATHLIAGSLTRAEKLMGSVAAGLWVLHPSYLEALKKVKTVNAIPEEDYEWGSPKQKFRLNLLPTNAKDFARCSYEWRIAIGNGEPPPFKDMRVILHLSEAKYDSFKRLIEAGGGKVTVGQPPNYLEADASLCIFEPNSNENINFASLARRNIKCVALVYVSDILLKKKDAIDRNLVPEFLQYWNN